MINDSVTICSTLQCAPKLRERWGDRVNLAQMIEISEGSYGATLNVLNLMPDKMLHEYLWADLLIQSGYTGALQFVTTHSYIPKNIDSNYIKRNYVYTNHQVNSDINGWIVTGAPLGVRLNKFNEAHYWSELAFLFDQAQTVGVPVVGVCWGGNALFYHRYGIQIAKLHAKHIGLFDHLTTDNRVQFGIGKEAVYSIPVARHSGFGSHIQIEKLGLITDLLNREIGPGVIRSPDGLSWAVGNHLEYDLNTLVNEYQSHKDANQPLCEQMGELLTLGNTEHPPWRELAVNMYSKWLVQIS